MRLISTLATAATLLLAAPLASQAATLVPAGSEVTFVAKQIGVPLDGRFRKFDAQIALDPKQPQAGKVSFGIDLASVSMGPETDAELVKPEWFGTAKFPRATFVSTAIKPTAPGKYEVTGKLTIKGISRDLTVPVQLAASGANTVATGGFTLQRLAFKVGEGDWSDTSVVANDVQVKFKLNLKDQPLK